MAEDLENGLDDGFDDFDAIEVNTNRGQSSRTKAFAAQRRAVKPNRRHAASKNPVKILQNRTSDVFEDEDEEEEERTDSAVKQNGTEPAGEKRGKFTSQGSFSKTEDIKLIGRHSRHGSGRIKTRDVELTADAKKGLETVEDIHAASKSLRTTAKDSKTGIGTEKTNPYDGVKPVMFFHIKGGRHVQTRLVKPCCSSMNSGDVFVLVTPKYVHQWNGKNCSIMEKARGAEVSSVIHQWKELGCAATFVNVMDEGREKPAAATKAFWKALSGDKKDIQQIDDVLEDKLYEKGILESNQFYEIQCEGENTELVQIDEYTGKVPSKKWLDPTKAYVLDFGSEVYSWIGSKCNTSARRLAAEVGLKHYNEGFKTEAYVHPYNLNEENNAPGERLERPAWSVYGRMAEKTENVAFRRKFYDWPDPVDLKVKTVDAKVHAQLTREYSGSGESQLDDMKPIEARTLIAPTEEPLMILDGMFLGRGKGMQDMETLFKYGVTLNQLTVWQVSDTGTDQLSKERCGTFFSGEAYIIKWELQYFRTGIRHLKGGKSKQEDRGVDRSVFFFWQGTDCSASDKGTAALMTVDLDTEDGPQILVQQGKESPAFFQLFDGKMVVHAGKSSDAVDFDETRMYWVRNEVDVEMCLVEVPLSSASLRSRGSFVIAEPSTRSMFVWHGAKSTVYHQERSLNAAKYFRDNLNTLYNKNLSILEINEGDEEEEFWDALLDDLDYVSFLEVSKKFNFTPRCFSFDSLHGYFQATELTSSAIFPDQICAFPLLQTQLYELSQPALVLIDCKHKQYLWQGWWPVADDELECANGPNTHAEKHRFDVNRKLAMETIKLYSEAKKRSLSRVYLVHAGVEPLEFINLFPFWHQNEDIAKLQLEAGRVIGQKQKMITVLEQLSKDEYTLEELKARPLPEGVDPARIEKFLNKEEFQQHFLVSKDEFPKLPKWKQIELKKKVGMF